MQVATTAGAARPARVGTRSPRRDRASASHQTAHWDRVGVRRCPARLRPGSHRSPCARAAGRSSWGPPVRPCRRSAPSARHHRRIAERRVDARVAAARARRPSSRCKHGRRLDATSPLEQLEAIRSAVAAAHAGSRAWRPRKTAGRVAACQSADQALRHSRPFCPNSNSAIRLQSLQSVPTKYSLLAASPLRMYSPSNRRLHYARGLCDQGQMAGEVTH